MQSLFAAATGKSPRPSDLPGQTGVFNGSWPPRDADCCAARFVRSIDVDCGNNVSRPTVAVNCLLQKILFKTDWVAWKKLSIALGISVTILANALR